MIAAIAIVQLWVVVVLVPMVMSVESRLMVRGRTGRGTAVKGIDATGAKRALEDVVPVLLRTLDVRPGCVVRRAANSRRGWTRWKRQCCHVMIELQAYATLFLQRGLATGALRGGRKIIGWKKEELVVKQSEPTLEVNISLHILRNLAFRSQ